MNILIQAGHNWPIPTPVHTGDIVILDLATALDAMGHRVSLIAPAGTAERGNIRLLPIAASEGRGSPTAAERDAETIRQYSRELQDADVVHDFSATKQSAAYRLNIGGPQLSTLMGGCWRNKTPGINVVGWSRSHADRIQRGATDYENTATPKLGGEPGEPIREVMAVHGGVDTSWYTPGGERGDFLLWLGRWDRSRGYREAIELARAIGQHVVLAGQHPDDCRFEPERRCALEAELLAKQAGDDAHVTIEWLPAAALAHQLRKRELYRQARAYLFLPQFQEPFGLSQVEAMACGTPVIATRMGSVVSVVKDGWTGMTADNDPKSIYCALIGLLASYDISPGTCRDHAVRRFDRSVMASNYVKLYERVMRGENWGVAK